MSQDIFTKEDILQKLANDGYFVDSMTLDSFVTRFKLEAIFEDEHGVEYYDRSAYDTIIQNVLPPSEQQKIEENIPELKFQDLSEDEEFSLRQQEELQNDYKEETSKAVQKLFGEENLDNSFENLNEEPKEENKEVAQENSVSQSKNVSNSEILQILDELKLSDGSNVLDKIAQEDEGFAQDIAQLKSSNVEQDEDISLSQMQAMSEQENNEESKQALQEEQEIAVDEHIQKLATETIEVSEEKYMSAEVIEANATRIQEESKNEIRQALVQAESDTDFDDMSLLSDSIQAQEKFQNYLMAEMARKNKNFVPTAQAENAFKLDISEKTLNMIARSIAKKIARQVGAFLANDTKNNVKLAQAEQKAKMLEEKIALLENQNKKLKLLLVESNKNLNAYKPTFFGLYKFVTKKTGKNRK